MTDAPGRITARWINRRDVQALMQTFESDGFQAYFVGGCVRNTLLQTPVSDIDISTNARPDAVVETVTNAGFTAHPTGIDHGTVTVVTPGGAFEVTTYRKDVETDGRRAVVAFADTIEEDALRRDLTMNALYADRHGTLVDPLGGLPDLMARRVRFIEDPGQRIREDYLRILRFFRFFAHYGDPKHGLDPDGLSACAAHVEGLATLSKERVGAEMLKLLAAPDPAPAVAAMEAAGCLAQILPGSTSEALAPLIHLEQRVRHDPIRRLAVLGGQSVRDDLRLSNADARDRTAIRAGALASSSAGELAYRIGPARALDAMLVRHALLGQMMPKSVTGEIEKGAQAVFPVKAADLPELSGKALGDQLRQLEADWVASGFSLTKTDLLK